MITITRRAIFTPLLAAALLAAGAGTASAQPRDLTREITRAAAEASRDAAAAAREIADAVREAGFATHISARDIDKLIDDLMRDLMNSINPKRAISPVATAGAQLLGAKDLKPERSVNLSAGFAVEPGRDGHRTASADLPG